MEKLIIQKLLAEQRTFFASNKTKDISFRKEQLQILKKALIASEQAIYDALKRDLNKPAFETYGGDIAMVIREIDYVSKRLGSWSRPKKVRTPLAYFPCSSSEVSEPYGVVLIVSPWNFPFQLTFMPLVGSIAAGNCSLLKPPIDVRHSSSLIAKIIAEHFDPGYISAMEGGAETAQMLLEERFDYIFFTGGPSTGKLVMQAAAKHLTPLTLELGGKNPCIVDADTHIDYTARRIAWGKFFNAGQSCVSVDYLLVDRRIKQKLLDRLAVHITEFYGTDPSLSPDYVRILDDRHFDRLAALLSNGKIAIGGKTDRASRYIAPTMIDAVKMSDPIMQDEIFGPILPVLEYDSLSDAISLVNSRPKPLALYFFSSNRKNQERVLRETSSGGGCINDAQIHETTTLAFGGAGPSGIGKYHGKASFDLFSNKRGIIRNSFLFDSSLRYPPYRNHLKWVKKIF